MKVLKFGGTSMASAESLSRVVDIIYHHQQESKVICVVSAAAGVTDLLYRLAKIAEKELDFDIELESLLQRHIDLLQSLEPTAKSLAIAGLQSRFAALKTLLTGVQLLAECTLISLDNIVTTGEILSSFVLHSLLLAKKISANLIDAKEYILLYSTQTAWKSATVKHNFLHDSLDIFETSNTIITQGFIASDNNNIVTTLGRGGSDYSAALFAAAVNADELLIYSDVDGIFNCDPRIYPNAKLISKLSYSSIKQLAYWGVKAFHPFSIKPALEKNVRVIALNTFKSKNQGTEIVKEEIENHALPMAIYKNACFIDIELDTDKPENECFRLIELLAQKVERTLNVQIDQSRIKFLISDELSSDNIISIIDSVLTSSKVSFHQVSAILLLGNFESKMNAIYQIFNKNSTKLHFLVQEQNCLKIIFNSDNINEKAVELRKILDG